MGKGAHPLTTLQDSSNRPAQSTPRACQYSSKLEELVFATWQRMQLNNAKANLSEEFRETFMEFAGCVIDRDPSYTLDERPYIQFLGTIAPSC